MFFLIILFNLYHIFKIPSDQIGSASSNIYSYVYFFCYFNFRFCEESSKLFFVDTER